MKLRTESIVKKYKNRTVVKGVSVEVNQGEIVGLLGPNGAGKTTSFYMIVGLVKPDQGKVFLDGKEITNEAMYKRAKMGIGYLPQEVSVFRKLTVEDNIMAVLEMTKLKKKERKQRLEELLEEFSLTHVRKNTGQKLSGGEKRRTEIARSLATNPSFILLDEPFAGVDPIAVEDIQRIVWKLKERNIGVLITDHNVQETLAITDRTYLLFEGNILKSGSAEDLAADEQVRKVYLGENFELRKNVFQLDQTAEEREASHKANDSRYIRGLIKRVRNIEESISNWDYYLVTFGIANYHGVDILKNDLEEAQKHFAVKYTDSTTSALVDRIKLDKINRYQLSGPKALNWVKFLWILIPGFGPMNYRKVKRLKTDLQHLIRDLDSLKHYADNPALAKLGQDAETENS